MRAKWISKINLAVTTALLCGVFITANKFQIADQERTEILSMFTGLKKDIVEKLEL